MPLPYGFLKGRAIKRPHLQSKPHRNEIQYHLHFSVEVAAAPWDVAVNVGTSDDDDSLLFKFVFDFHHPMVETLKAAPTGQTDLTGRSVLPALDFERSDILKDTGDWRRSDPMDGTDQTEPASTMRRLLLRADDAGWMVYAFGRFYDDGDGAHDIHMNQGSTGETFRNNGGEPPPHWDGNDVWQDGAIFVDRGAQGFAAYFARFTQQVTPTDDSGNPAG
ncbi:MAG: DUF2278 family protein [Acetobacteraceae bacterium]|nr:DUF2278 family protein [Acetobacteraceae bacterium]